MPNVRMNAPSLSLCVLLASSLLVSCGKPDAGSDTSPPPTVPVTIEQAQEFVPRTFSGNDIAMPESTSGVTVTAELKPTDDKALTGCSAIVSQEDRYGCEDEIRIARANENANPSDCEFVHDPESKSECVMGATVRKAQNEHDPKVCAALTATGAAESCRVSAIMGNPMRNPTVEECGTIGT